MTVFDEKLQKEVPTRTELVDLEDALHSPGTDLSPFRETMIAVLNLMDDIRDLKEQREACEDEIKRVTDDKESIEETLGRIQDILNETMGT